MRLFNSLHVDLWSTLGQARRLQRQGTVLRPGLAEKAF